MIQVVIAPAHLAGREATPVRDGDLRLDNGAGVSSDYVRLATLPADRLPRFRELLGSAPEPGDAAWAAAVVGAVNEPMVRT